VNSVGEPGVDEPDISQVNYRGRKVDAALAEAGAGHLTGLQIAVPYAK
jgi:hypothetical protein